MAEENCSGPKMKCIVLTKFGGYDKMIIEHTLKPIAEPGTVIVSVKACGMNFCDLITRQGLYTFQGVKPPFIMGIECSGVIEDIGEGVYDLQIGDRVMCWTSEYGMWAEYVKISSEKCYKMPIEMTFEEGAAFPINFLTAYFVLIKFANLRPGQNVLIQAAAGGVGWAATQLTKTVENVTVFGTASVSKHKAIRDNGVMYAIDYHTHDFVTEVQKISKKGVDIVIDCLSGSDFAKAQKIVKHMGYLVHIGMSSIINGENRNLFRALKVWWNAKSVSILNLVQNNQSVCGFNLTTLVENEPEVIHNALQHLLQMYEEGKIKPRIDSIWPFEKVSDATVHMVNRNNIGKIILVPSKLNQEAIYER